MKPNNFECNLNSKLRTCRHALSCTHVHACVHTTTRQTDRQTDRQIEACKKCVFSILYWAEIVQKVICTVISIFLPFSKKTLTIHEKCICVYLPSFTVKACLQGRYFSKSSFWLSFSILPPETHFRQV